MSLATPSAGRRTHLVPTHVRTPETLLTVAGLSLSVRQFLLILVGLALAYRVWSALAGLALWPVGQAVRIVLSLFPLLLALALAFVQLAARPLDTWGLTLLRFWVRPHYFVWRSIRFAEGPGGVLHEEENDDETTH